jgi:hypothetical protein
MALQIALDRTAETGDTYPVAYWRIDGLQWSRADVRLDVTVGVYRDQAAAAKQPVVTRAFHAIGPVVNQILNANDIRAAIYVWLKQKSEFAGAQDV